MRTGTPGAGRISFCATGALGAPVRSFVSPCGFLLVPSLELRVGLEVSLLVAAALDASSLADRPLGGAFSGYALSRGLTLSRHPACASPASAVDRHSRLIRPTTRRRSAQRSRRAPSARCEAFRQPHRRAVPAISLASRAPSTSLRRVPLFQGPTRGLLRWVHGRPEVAFAGVLPRILFRLVLPRALLATEPCGGSATQALSLG